MNEGMSAQGGSALGRKKIITEQFDVLVVGGGPAGLMAAGRAAQKGARVALIEKNDRYGIKLLMSGNGRCNLTQDVSEMFEFVKAYKNGRFLLSAFKRMSPNNSRDFFRSRGVETKVEKNGKVFPVSDQGKDVLDALYQYCRENMVTFFNAEEVVGIEKRGDKIVKVITKKKEISAEKYILATGGKSYPHTGSTGKAFGWLSKLGHKIVEPQPSLVPIMIVEQTIKDAQGLSAHNVSMIAVSSGKKIAASSGDLMFAHYGISGPLALNISRDIMRVILSQAKNPENQGKDKLNSEILTSHCYAPHDDNSRLGEIKLLLDLKPELSFEQVDEIVRKDFEDNGHKNLSNCLKDFASPKMLELVFAVSGLDPTKHVGKISKQDRHKIVSLFKKMEMTVEGLFGFEKAMVTSGGVSTKEIDSKTMRSKIIENLYFAGEVIDVDGPTGGYNLQVCWSTGYVAGENAAMS
ncbi:MAG: NAD(P)/FAD-dependent oxidoreductase [Candidatus Moranbacteria bacterium]|nr:NAD(P)/FAD-dependent oxidoreductase [Candidatus Moranbacteria bacterium]